ncbi:hypothetical protein HanIR_Chr12g0581511 [Helianthus annuus]|nr:hypothetical protein HanIR_Chr12g0581511 [Helianthus annuus]
MRRVKVKTIKSILSMDESVQRDILALGVPMADDCERTQKVIRRMKRKFPADDFIDHTGLLTVIKWGLDEQARTVKMTYRHGVKYSLPMDDMLKTERLHLLEQLCDLAPSNDTRSRVVMIFKYRLQQR